ncbi:MAG TPA: hypothetical protein ENI99_11760 [Sedimenticola sp.]|nr:hypothetical protein [Sedimenticola sp.]
MNELLHQALGIFVCIVSAGVFISRYGIPPAGTAIGYLAFGTGFVAAGVGMGKMMDADILGLLVLEQWNFNLSLMAIGYSAAASGIAGISVALRDFFRKV